MNTKICWCIGNRDVITFNYKGHPRRVEPYLLGYDKDGGLTLSAWQLSGGSGTGWRNFHVSKISGIATTAYNFSQTRQGYNRYDSTMSQILCRH